MRHVALHSSGSLAMLVSLIVVLFVSSLTWNDQDDSYIPYPQGHGALLEQALEPDLGETKTSGLTVPGNVETAVALLPCTNDRLSEQYSQPVEPSSPFIFQRCSTYRI